MYDLLIQREINPDKLREFLELAKTHPKKINDYIEKLFGRNQKVWLAYNQKYVIVRSENIIGIATCNMYNRRIKRPEVVQKHGRVIVKAIDTKQTA